MISIIIPEFNSVQYISHSLISVSCQIEQGWQLVAVDDGSSDSGPEILRQATANDSRIHPHFLKVNSGSSAARNVALSHATGEVICYLDSDDEYYPDHLANVAEHIGRADVLIFGYDVVTPAEGGEKVSTYYPAEHYFEFFQRNTVTPVGFVHCRSLLEKSGLFDEDKFFEVDWDLFKRIAATGASMLYLPLKRVAATTSAPTAKRGLSACPIPAARSSPPCRPLRRWPRCSRSSRSCAGSSPGGPSAPSSNGGRANRRGSSPGRCPTPLC